MNYENVTKLYTEASRLALPPELPLTDRATSAKKKSVQADSTNSALGQSLEDLKRSLSCYVCYSLLQDPCSVEGVDCQHYVCRKCVGGKLKLPPGGSASCAECKGRLFVADSRLRVHLSALANLCRVILLTLPERLGDPNRLHKIKDVAVEICNAVGVTIPVASTHLTRPILKRSISNRNVSPKGQSKAARNTRQRSSLKSVDNFDCANTVIEHVPQIANTPVRTEDRAVQNSKLSARVVAQRTNVVRLNRGGAVRRLTRQLGAVRNFQGTVASKASLRSCSQAPVNVVESSDKSQAAKKPVRTGRRQQEMRNPVANKQSHKATQAHNSHAKTAQKMVKRATSFPTRKQSPKRRIWLRDRAALTTHC